MYFKGIDFEMAGMAWCLYLFLTASGVCTCVIKEFICQLMSFYGIGDHMQAMGRNRYSQYSEITPGITSTVCRKLLLLNSRLTRVV